MEVMVLAPSDGAPSEEPAAIVVQGLQGIRVEQLAPFGSVTIPVTLLPLQPGVHVVDGIHGFDGEGKPISCTSAEIYVQRSV